MQEGSEADIVLFANLFASEPYTVNIVTSPGTAEGGFKVHPICCSLDIFVGHLTAGGSVLI